MSRPLCLVQVSSPKMVPLFERAKSLAKNFDELEMHHIERGLNSRADALANMAMDARWSGSHMGPIISPS